MLLALLAEGLRRLQRKNIDYAPVLEGGNMQGSSLSLKCPR